MKNVKFVVVLAALCLALPALNGHGQEARKQADKPKKLDELMKDKLTHAQKVLEGVALNDFDRIAKHAEELLMVSKQAEWKVIKTAQYELYSNEFRRNADTLIKNAKDKNLDGAALTYVELTLTCVKCHKYVREQRMTRLD
jgi:hypothetical protein